MYDLSVIVPVYRVEKYLRKCLDSVVAQTLKNIEVIIVDDGSDDNSGAIADAYAERYPNFICIHKENGGSASARTNGMKIASGEYVAFLDSDDWVDDCAYEELYNTAVNNNKPDVIMYRSHGEKGGYYYPPVGHYDRSQIEKVILPHLMPYYDDGKPKYLRVSNCMKIYKRKFLIESGVNYRDGLLIHEDVLFTFDCIDRAQTFYYSDKELYHVTVNPQSKSRTPYNKNKTESMLLIAEYIREYHLRNSGFDYGDSIFSAMLYFFEEGIVNEMRAPSTVKSILGIKRILDSEICRWYKKQEKPVIDGWYGKVQKNIVECGTLKLLYRMKYKSKIKKRLFSVK